MSRPNWCDAQTISRAARFQAPIMPARIRGDTSIIKAITGGETETSGIGGKRRALFQAIGFESTYPAVNPGSECAPSAAFSDRRPVSPGTFAASPPCRMHKAERISSAPRFPVGRLETRLRAIAARPSIIRQET